jgi:outer membrane receptor protein involved in Fe transport
MTAITRTKRAARTNTPHIGELSMPALVRTLGICTLLAFASLGNVALAQTHEFNIPAGTLADALETLGNQAGLQIMYEPAVAQGIRVDSVVGKMTSDEVLARLLTHTDLQAKRVNEKTIVLTQLPATRDSPPPTAAPTAPATTSQTSELADKLDEIVVTAQKREQRLQDVPVPVTALDGNALVESNETRLQDYYSGVPGLNLALDNRGSAAIAVRGLTTTIYGNPTVATVIDDVPYAGSTSAAFSWAATEFDPNELTRIEVLRGPQGVLYGASSLGGLIKFVTVKPSTSGLDGRLQVSGNSVEGGGEGYGVSGAINVPLSDTFAIRASGFHRHDPGYVDNVLAGERDVNDSEVNGGRVAALWQASEKLSLELSAVYQSARTGGSPNIESRDVAGSPLADLQQSYIGNSGGYNRRLQAYTATLNAKAGAVDVTSISGYAVSNSKGSFDTSNLPFTLQFSGQFFNVPYTAWVEDNETRKFSQELRFSGAFSDRVDWVAGGFYTDETTDLAGGQTAFQGSSWAPLGAWFTSSGPVGYRETAAFANVTPHITERFEVQLGARYSENDQTFEQMTSFGLGAPVAAPKVSSSESATTWLVGPTFRFSRDLMVYGRIASGFRPGGANTAVTATSGNPRVFAPDKTQNYELGLKGAFFDNRLSLNASIFSIDWRDIQITISDVVNAETYAANLGEARTRGAELEFGIRPTTALTIGGWVAYTDAKLTADFPPGAAFGSRGERLPYSSRFSGNLFVQQAFPLMAGASGFVKATLTRIGERQGEFASGFGAGRQIYDGYTTVDLLGSARFESWTANVYANNISDKRGVLAGGLGTLNTFSFTYIQPRTIGFSLAKSF